MVGLGRWSFGEERVGDAARARRPRRSPAPPPSPQVCFIVLAGCTRATLQGALCRVPGILHLFAAEVNEAIFLGGIVTLALCSSLGFYALDRIGGLLLRRLHRTLGRHQETGHPPPPPLPSTVSWRHADRLRENTPLPPRSSLVDPEYYSTEMRHGRTREDDDDPADPDADVEADPDEGVRSPEPPESPLIATRTRSRTFGDGQESPPELSLQTSAVGTDCPRADDAPAVSQSLDVLEGADPNPNPIPNRRGSYPPTLGALRPL